VNPVHLNFDWLNPMLAVGGYCPREAVERLAREHAVRAVVDLRSEACDDAGLLEAHGLAFLHLPTDDLCAVTQASLDAGVAFAAAHRDRGEPVLIHCQHGIGRSVLLALCVLVDAGMDPLDAMRLTKDKRAVASPSPAQYEAWAEWLRRRRTEPPHFDQFAAIAYRHLRRD